MIDEIDSKQQKQRKNRTYRLDLFSHIHALVGVMYQIISTIFLGIIITISLIKICWHGLYDWLHSIIQILNSLEWTSIVAISLFVTLKTAHSISTIYIKKKYNFD